MNCASLLLESYGRVRDLVPRVVGGLDPARLAWRPDGTANSIGWLVWHQSRIHDDHLADVAGFEQVWTADGWYDRLGLDLSTADTGYGHSPESVGKVRATADLLAGYDAAVAAKSAPYLAGLRDADLDRVVDENWTPAVTLGVRLVSVLSDCLQHLGQASYLRGSLLP